MCEPGNDLCLEVAKNTLDGFTFFRCRSRQLRGHIARLPLVTMDNGESVSVTVSIGIACVPIGTEEDADSLIKRADAALYKAKQSGRNRVVNE